MGHPKESVAATTTEVLGSPRKDTAPVVSLYLRTVSLVRCVVFPQWAAHTEPTTPTTGQAHSAVHHNYF